MELSKEEFERRVKFRANMVDAGADHPVYHGGLRVSLVLRIHDHNPYDWMTGEDPEDDD